MIEFSEWHAWNERSKFVGIQSPGVYCLAHFDIPPTGPADPMSSEIVYIGQTGRSLQIRWSNFNYSASHVGPKERRGHSGGRCYWRTHKGTLNNLYVAAVCIGPSELRTPVQLEKQLLHEFVAQRGCKPQFNTR